MSPQVTIPTEQVSAVRRELSRMESKRRWPLTGRSGEAGRLRTARIQLGAAMLAAMEHGEAEVSLELGSASTNLVLEAFDRVRAAGYAR
jgi:hypothetical protein